MECKRRSYLPRQHKNREMYMRYPIIVVIGILMPLIYDDYQFFTRDYNIAIGVSILRTAALWLGSKEIVEFILSRMDFMKSTAKTLTYQVAALIIYTFIVISVEIFVLESFTSYKYTFHDKVIFYENATLITLFITTIYASTFFFFKWKENLLKAERLEKATLEAKYETLKNQVNPHFLFNSLNTLAGMLDEGSVSQVYVQNLSEFLRYVLQIKDKELVLVREEMDFSRQYSFIQLKRFGGKLSINFIIPENFLSCMVPPLSIQMLIENAIKHNIISKEKPLRIDIYVNSQNSLVVENNLQRKEAEETTGLGLENIRNRYQYLNKSDILVKETDGKFIVELPLLHVNYNEKYTGD